MPGIQRDDFPATIHFNGQAYRRARSIVDDEGRAVVVLHGANGIETLVRGTGAEAVRNRETGRVEVRTAEGDFWEIERGGGCGCGSMLKRVDKDKALAGQL